MARYEKYDLRLPLGMRARIKELAAMRRLSMNECITKAIQDVLEIYDLWPLRETPESKLRKLRRHHASKFTGQQLGHREGCFCPFCIPPEPTTPHKPLCLHGVCSTPQLCQIAPVCQAVSLPDHLTPVAPTTPPKTWEAAEGTDEEFLADSLKRTQPDDDFKILGVYPRAYLQGSPTICPDPCSGVEDDH